MINDMKRLERNETEENKLGVFEGQWGWVSEAGGKLGSHVSGIGNYAGKGPEAVKSSMYSRNVKKASDAEPREEGKSGRREVGGTDRGQVQRGPGAAGSWVTV